ncbi:RNA-binding protein FUS [Drosophila elegans]|uniref:RNA-binding protein FUS n=1 Tax=Drosophila elegans TaxID=30023 RepID=UPI0007E6A2F9|nr:RNA-binding protein FUS [Drosophila elegans]
MSNGFSYWNGQPVNAPVYPQMGDLMQPSGAGGSGAAPAYGPPGSGVAAGAGWPGQGAAAPAQYPSQFAAGGCSVQSGMAMPSAQPQQQQQHQQQQQQMGMGDYGNMSSPLTCNVPANFFGQGAGQSEPCIDNGEAFCAYNGMDMSMNYGGGSASKGGYW